MMNTSFVLIVFMLITVKLIECYAQGTNTTTNAYENFEHQSTSSESTSKHLLNDYALKKKPQAAKPKPANNKTSEQQKLFRNHQQNLQQRLKKPILTAADTATAALPNAEAKNLTHDDESYYVVGVPLYLKILASIGYITAMILGIGGNALTIVVLFFQRSKTVTNFFIVNLAISDLIFALLCIPSTYVAAYIVQFWPFTAALCVFFNYMQTVSVTLTVYTLIWITLDKYWGLVRPLKLRISLRVCKYLIAFSWLFSLLISFPFVLFTKLTYTNVSDVVNNNNDMNEPQCIEQWPNNQFAQTYNLFLFVVQYLMPLVILSFCYAKIGIVLRKMKAPGECIKNRDAKMTQSKKKMVKMCFVMVLTFMIFWAPLHFLTIYRFYNENVTSLEHFGDVFFVCHMLAVSRSFVNPFIYVWTNGKYRTGFKYFICCYCLSEKHKDIIYQTRDNAKFAALHRSSMLTVHQTNSNAPDYVRRFSRPSTSEFTLNKNIYFPKRSVAF